MVQETFIIDSVKRGAFMEKKKRIGYLAEQYRDVRYKDELPTEFDDLFDKYKKKAQKVHAPDYLVKGAQIFFTYNNQYYQLSPWRLSCSEEVFELLADELIDAMYKLGAYDMFYAGMVD